MDSTLKGTTNYLRNQNGGPSKNSFSKFKPSSLFSRFSRKNNDTEAEDIATNVTGKNTYLKKLNETLKEILYLLKTNIQEDKDRFSIERTFQEEKDREDEQRHKEFLTVLNEFVQNRGFVIEEKKDEKSNLFDIFKSMFDKLKAAFKSLGLRLLKLSRFVFNTGRLILRIFGWPALIIGGIYALLKFINKIMPDLTKVDYKEAGGMLADSDTQIEDYLKRHPNAIPPEYMNRAGLTARQKIEAFVNDQKSSRLTELRAKEQAGTITPAEKTELQELELNPRATATTPTQLPNAPTPRPATPAGWNTTRRTADQISWDNKFGRTHNPDGTPKVQTTARPLGNVTPSTVGAGRGGQAEMNDYMAREEEAARQAGNGGAAFGIYPSAAGNRRVSPMPSMPSAPEAAPSSTPPAGISTPEPNSLYLNNIIRDNYELNLREMFQDMSEEPTSIIGSSNSSKSNIGPTIGPEAAQRDDTYTLNVVLSRYKRAYV